MKGNENNQDMCPRCMTPLQGQRVCPKCKFDPSTYTPAKHHLPPRTILDGKYLVGCVLGEGGFGITYVGWDLQLHTMVAIKEYFPTGIVFRDNTQSNVVSVFSGSGEEYYLHDREKFLEEARMLAKFDGNPGVVSVKNYFKENGTAYIVMEYVQGINLAVLMEQNNDKLPFDRVMKLLDLPIRTLAEMHRQNTFHRDISPENLMVTNDNVVKLIDFGSTKTNKKDKSRYLKVRPGYSPLELYTTGGQEGPFSDIYALSATIYKAVTGITPPPATDRINDDALVPPIRAGARGMNAAQEKALLKGMAVKAQDRYQRVEDLYTGLCGRGPSRKGDNRKPVPVIAVAASVVAALAIGGGLFAANRNHTWPFTKPTPIATVEPTSTPTPEVVESPTPEVIESPAPVVTEAPVETPTPWWDGVEPYALEESAFENVPGLWEQYNGERFYTTGVCAVISPSGLELRPVAGDRCMNYGLGGEYVGEGRADLKPEQLAGMLNAVHDLPVEELVLANWNLATLEPLARSWGDNVCVYFENCALPEDWAESVGAVGPGLRALWVAGNMDASDLRALNALPDLTELYMDDRSGQGECNVDLETVSRLINLTRLDLQSMAIEDIGLLEKLTNLTFLGVSDNRVTDLTPLEKLTNLTLINIDVNRVADLTPLAGLSNLDTLLAKENRISDLTPLAGLTGLVRVELANNLIGDFSPVSHVEEVTGREFQLSEETLAAVPEVYQGLLKGDVDQAYQLSAVISPAGIRFYGVDMDDGVDRENRRAWTWLTDEQWKGQMDFIQMIPLPVRRVVFVDWDWGPCNMDQFNREWVWLHEVEFVNCGLPTDQTEETDWGGLATLGERLERLGVYACGYDETQLSWLANCPRLTALYLDGSGDAQYLMDVLGRLNRIEELTLRDLNISDISALSNLGNLRRLVLRGNPVEDLSPLSGLENLDYLDVQDCRVRDISPLGALKDRKLREVHLEGNFIQDFEPVMDISFYGEGRQLIPLTADMFAETPEVWADGEVGRDGFPYELRLQVSKDGVCVRHAYVDNGDDDSLWPWDVSRDDINGEMISAIMNTVQRCNLPIREIVIHDMNLNGIENFARPMPGPVTFRFYNCATPDDLRALTGFGGALDSIDLWGEYSVDDMSWLCDMPGLESISLGFTGGGTRPIDLSGFKGMGDGLFSLNLAQYDIENPEGLSGLKLHYLSIQNCNLQDITFLEGMTDIEWLMLAAIPLEDISPLKNLHNLRELRLGETRVSDLTPLSGLSSLEYLDVTDTPVTDFTPVAHVPTVEGRD